MTNVDIATNSKLVSRTDLALAVDRGSVFIDQLNLRKEVMSNLCKSLSVVILILICPLAHALSGSEYRALAEAQRQMWAVGVVDGLMTGQLVASNKTPPSASCLAKLEREQIRAIFEKALEKEPEVWHFQAAMIFHRTFQKYCKIE